MRTNWIVSALCVLAFFCLGISAGEQERLQQAIVIGEPTVPVTINGDLEYPIEAVAGSDASLTFGGENAIDYQVRMQIMLASDGNNDLILFSSNPSNPKRSSSALRLSIGRDPHGRRLTFRRLLWNKADRKYVPAPGVFRHLNFEAIDSKSQARITEDEIEAPNFSKRFIDLRLDVTKKHLVVWVEHNAVFLTPMPEPNRGKMLFTLAREDRVRQIKVTYFNDEALLVPLEFGPSANDQFKQEIEKTQLTLAGIPFKIEPDRRSHLNLHEATWVDQSRDPASYYSHYDGGPYVLGDQRMPFLRVPLADYAAMHLLAVAEDDPAYTNEMAIRVGRYGFSSQVVHQDFMATVPRANEGESVYAAAKIETTAGPLFHVRVPLDRAFAQDVEGGILEIELNKPLGLTRHYPDPNRFRYRPVGLPSGVRIAAITLEKSPLQMRVTSDEVGHAFVEPDKPVFRVELTNITDQSQSYSLMASTKHLRGGETSATQQSVVGPGASAVVDLLIEPVRRGYHDIVISLTAANGEVVLSRHTSFAQLMPDQREHRDLAPWGTWTWAGGHFTSKNGDHTGNLLHKLGFRYGMSGDDIEMRKKYGVLPGFELRVEGGLESYQKSLAATPDAPKRALIFHEHSISGAHIVRVPDLFHDRPPYKLSETEQEQFDKLWKQAIGGAKAIRENYPDVFLKFGNGPLPTKEEFYRAGFPAELFDAAGNEPGSFGRLPESQPPDVIAYNASIWMDRQLLDAYDYSDKPVRQCFEVGYPSDNPGNLDSRTQADYFVRHVLHAMAWEMPFIHIGELIDVGNSYYFSNWGAAGFCKAYPEMNVKPAYAALSVMSNILDGARFYRSHDMGSDSLYGVEFIRPNHQHVLAFWTVRGRRPIVIMVPGIWTLVDDQGNETPSPSPIVATTSPQYLVGLGDVGAITPSEPEYDDLPSPRAMVIAGLKSLNDWTLETDRNAELESYNFLTPRRKGDFEFAPSTDGAIRITPQPITDGKDTMPMYAVLAHNTGIPMPGEPELIGVWIKGNSGWGRIIFDIEDADGERWISIGAQEKADVNSWLLDRMTKGKLQKLKAPDMNHWNTNDSHGISRINFDGWRYVAFPLPGNYPHDHHHKPANNWWRHSDDGVVRYPFTLRKLVIEIPEKVLHLKGFRAPRETEIQIKDLTVE